MEKHVAHYSLDELKLLIRENRYRVTLSARKSYTELGLEDKEVLQIVTMLKPKDLYKSMTSYHNHTIWHDVYHAHYRDLELYIKLQICDNAIIISFKERT
jgi:motility quorum-sensing regulator/GCU-specific mRNA interferase toxin